VLASTAVRPHREPALTAVPPIVPGRLDFDAGGVPWSPLYGDIFHAGDGGGPQARHVFLSGNGLPEGWRDRDAFTVVETGFGLGVNFLETWRAAAADPHRPARLHYVAIEKHPFDAATLRRVHGDDAYATGLLAQWPPLLAGLHRLHLDAGRIVLTLAFGDAETLLPRLHAPADAIYLDGFAPAKNPTIWSPAVLREIGRLARPGATLATWSVATAVREGLVAAGFAVTLRPGFARKREMLVARMPGTPPGAPRPGRAVVIGAGLAGTSMADRLASRGWSVCVIDRAAAIAQGASGNPAGVVQPVLNLADAPNARLSRAAFVYAIRRFRALSNLAWRESGVLRLARDAAQQERFAKIVEGLGAPPDYAQCVDGDAAAALAGRAVSGAGVWFPQGGWVHPAALCAAQLDAHDSRIERLLGRTIGIADLAALAADGLVIDATGAGIERLLPVAEVRGQVTYLPAAPTRALAIAVTGDGYIAPMPDGGHCAGASFGHDDTDLAPRANDHADNLARVARMLPGFAHGLDAATLHGRAGLRVTTPDRVPAFGFVRDRYAVATGLGARGLVWAPLCAELFVSQLHDEPLPVERDLAAAIAPARFAAATPTS
jgi:tRNA 5-methylaminomethyl-2-thiouridine biosynthesis bifunctional protein